MADAGQVMAPPPGAGGSASGSPPGPPPGSPPGSASGSPPGSAPGSPPGSAPGPPPGPGVQPPFVVAPIEGRRTRTWLSVGVAGGLLAACCGIGGVAIGGLLVVGTEAVNEQAQTAVDEYLAEVAEQDWEQAYELRCEDDRDRLSMAEFVDEQVARPQIESYDVGDLDVAEMTVPARVTYADGSGATLAVPVEQSSETGRFEVCGTVAEQ